MNSIFCYFQLFFARSSSLDVKNFKMPGTKCRVKDCGSTQYHRGISLHRFPLGQELVQILQKWIDFVNIPSFEPTKHSRICSLHFLDSDYYINHLGKKCLNRQAIPSVKVCSDDETDAEDETFIGAVTEGEKSYGRSESEPTTSSNQDSEANFLVKF